jgi:glycosyltransferase involved in cell wall biosynthesis
MVTFPLRSTLPHVPVPRCAEQASDSKLLLAVGRLTPEKGFDRLIEAFAQLAPCFPDWRLCVLGEGPGRQALVQLTERLGMSQRISMPGTVGNVGDWYEAADLYVLTSLFEGFPNSLLEAMAYGLPTVSVDCDTGPRDIVRHGVDGILVPQDNPAALVNALQRLMDDKRLRDAYAAKAVEVRQRFSILRILRQWQRLFEGIIMDNRRASI